MLTLEHNQNSTQYINNINESDSRPQSTCLSALNSSHSNSKMNIT